MTISISNGDLFAPGFDAVVIPVNCVGAMGAGLAREAARRWPGVEAPYKAACSKGWMAPGELT